VNLQNARCNNKDNVTVFVPQPSWSFQTLLRSGQLTRVTGKQHMLNHRDWH